MFDFVRNNRRIVQFVLAGITLPFAFWGVDSYVRNASDSNDVATVGGTRISRQEFLQALQQQQDRLRASADRSIPQELLDTPEIRQDVLNRLVDQRMLLLHANQARMGINDAQLAQFIASVPSLQEDGKFSKQKYETLVAAQGMSKEAFEARLRQDLSMQQLLGPVGASMAPKAGTERWLAAQLEEREVAAVLFAPEQYLAEVKLAPDAARQYYDSHRAAFEVPEQLRAEYLALTRQSLLDQVTVSEEEIAAWYKSHIDQYKQAEERRASHILILAEKGVSDEVAKAAAAKAQDLAEKLRKAPGEFAALAKQHSQDPGSAAKGGDLDWFRRGMMVKPFEDSAFTLQEGQISGVVRSDFGFHIIKVTGVRAEQVRPLASVHAEIADQLKQQAAGRKFSEAVESFGNVVYEQADSLQPAADKFKLKIMQSGWMAKDGRGAGPLGQPKLLAALFSDDAIKNKRNTEAVEIGPDTLVAARVLEHKPATARAFEDVKSDIEKRLTLEEAAKLARKAGEAALAGLSGGKDAGSLKWGSVKSVPRSGGQDIPVEGLKAVFKADVAKLPAYAGAALPKGGYGVYRISQVKPFKGGSEDQAQGLRQQYAQILAGEEFSAWLATLR